MNKVILIGNLARDPELYKSSNGFHICKLVLAVNRNYTSASGEREVDYINVIVWRELAVNCAKYLAKGKKAAVFGWMQTRSYETERGERRYTTEVIANEVEFLSPKIVSEKETIDGLVAINDEDLPF